MPKTMRDEEQKYIVFVGPGNPFQMHGVTFERGVVYPVSEKVFEWAKAIKGIHEIKKISKEFVDFEEVKKGILG